MADSEDRAPEIIIVRRNGHDDDEGHHGGVWKIAFADFMTAMMCFFLVMWLINAANEQTRVALASYFNPVKLTDRNTNKKGIGKGPESANATKAPEAVSDTPTGAHDSESGPQENQNSLDADQTRKHSDKNLFSDPYAVLAEIAAETGTDQNISAKGDGGARDAGPSSGASGGESYRDPFAPDFWSQQVAVPRQGVQGDPQDETEIASGVEVETDETGKAVPSSEDKQTEERQPEKGGAEAQKAEVQGTGGASRETEVPKQELAAFEKVAPVEELAEKPHEEADGEDDKARMAEPAEAAEQEREQLAAEIRTELAEALAGANLDTDIEVTVSEDGVLVSVTDDMEHGMFDIGSAVPKRELVLAMEKIGGTLAGRPGGIKVHGHTDGRPFTSEDYDNWRLSTARAHSAYYMLVRGGLDEMRIREVAGFADRRLKVPGNPLADSNRRIDILLETGQ